MCSSDLDCVLMGLHKIMADRKPDLILSGVNHGHNLAEDVFYSGTVAGAREGAIMGIASIAMSQGFPPGARDAIPWACAETHGPRILKRLIEAGVPDYDYSTWYALFMPARTPAAIVNKVNAVTRQALATEDMKQKFDAQGVEPWTDTPAELGAYLKSETEKWGRVVKAANIPLL